MKAQEIPAWPSPRPLSAVKDEQLKSGQQYYTKEQLEHLIGNYKSVIEIFGALLEGASEAYDAK
jgi:hypothetical protein